MVIKSPPGFAKKRVGTNAHVSINASPAINSTKKNRTFMAIRAYVTTGTVLREVLSSPMGNMRLYSSFERSCARYLVWRFRIPGHTMRE